MGEPSFVSVAMAWSTSSLAIGTVRQWTDSSIALCATVPLATGTFHANSRCSSCKWRASQPRTWLSRNLLMNKLSPASRLAATPLEPCRQPFAQTCRESVGEDGTLFTSSAQFLNHTLLCLVQAKKCVWCCFAHISDSRTE